MDDDLLFPPDPAVRAVARELFATVRALPIVSFHTHVDPRWFAEDRPFPDPSALLVEPDHYLGRLLHALGEEEATGRERWHQLCARWPAFAETASRLWLEIELSTLFGIERLSPETADETYDAVAARLADAELRPRALLERFSIELVATTDPALDPLAHHAPPVVPTWRPDGLTDPTRPGWADAVARLGAAYDLETGDLDGLVAGLVADRQRFVARGAVASDHGPFSPATAALAPRAADRLYRRVLAGLGGPGEAALLGAHLIGLLAGLAADDGLVMQLHPGVQRDHDTARARALGPDLGADFPVATGFTGALHPLLERYGNSPRFTLVVYTVDEAAYARELAPMASYYPALRLGAPWWFLDTPGAMGRAFELMEVAGPARFAGFVDDARSLASIPARHEVARRVLCGHLAGRVATGRIGVGEAAEIAADYAYRLPKATFAR